jgi:hypothetical protein
MIAWHQTRGFEVTLSNPEKPRGTKVAKNDPDST